MPTLLSRTVLIASARQQEVGSAEFVQGAFNRVGEMTLTQLAHVGHYGFSPSTLPSALLMILPRGWPVWTLITVTRSPCLS
jgi:hypothetical protein